MHLGKQTTSSMKRRINMNLTCYCGIRPELRKYGAVARQFTQESNEGYLNIMNKGQHIIDNVECK